MRGLRGSLPGEWEASHVVRQLPQDGMLAQKLVHLHRGVEGKPTVVCPDVYGVRVDLVPKRKVSSDVKASEGGRGGEGAGARGKGQGASTW